VEGKGAVLEDSGGTRYLDGNSSIWTNLHGHNHPYINAALRKQLGRISHSSALGLANEPASVLAERLVKAAHLKRARTRSATQPTLEKVFFSDDGSTAMEVALKLAYEVSRRSGLSRRPRFLSLEGAYHGDTVGAVSLGHIDLFHKTWNGLLFKTDRVMAPYCYRCPFNRAKPERADARTHRNCNWECVTQVARACDRKSRKGAPYAGFVFEPRMQGAAGLIAQPHGWLRRVAEIVRGHGTLLIADEVMTGFGRVAPPPHPRSKASSIPLLASHPEGVQPDLAALAKGLTGGYLPMAATLSTRPVFDAFLGDYDEFKTFFHGHSFTGNQLGAAAGLANMELLARPTTVVARQRVEATLRDALTDLWKLPTVGDIRQEGCVAGIELVQDWRTRKPFDLRHQAGIRVCEAMARRGVLTRPIGNVVALMPPFCTTRSQVRKIVQVARDAIAEVFNPS
jgi:adenosylmethionine-8-amino-7-oxononanoate aminotransferase